MPPLYSWSCDECKKQIDILRHHDLCQDTPKPEDPGNEPTDCDHKWTKKFQHFKLIRGRGWAGKGNW